MILIEVRQPVIHVHLALYPTLHTFTNVFILNEKLKHVFSYCLLMYSSKLTSEKDYIINDSDRDGGQRCLCYGLNSGLGSRMGRTHVSLFVTDLTSRDETQPFRIFLSNQSTIKNQRPTLECYYKHAFTT